MTMILMMFGMLRLVMLPGLRFFSFPNAEEAANMTHAWICKKLRLEVQGMN